MTNEKALPHPDGSVIFAEIDGTLCLATRNGWPLYYYLPTKAADVGKPAPIIPWISEWPRQQDMTELALKYVPFPPAIFEDKSEVDEQLQHLLQIQARGEGSSFEQTIYNGWPVYTCKMDANGPKFKAHGVYEGQWALVTHDLEHLPLPPQTDLPYPHTISGP